jgi:hypothetical protein
MSIQTHSEEMKEHTKEKFTTISEITTEDLKFEMSSQYMKMPPRYFRDMLANKHEMTLCDLGASVGVMPRDEFEKLRRPLKPMAMCLELGNNSILYPMGIAEDAPIKTRETKNDIHDERSAFKM